MAGTLTALLVAAQPVIAHRHIKNTHEFRIPLKGRGEILTPQPRNEEPVIRPSSGHGETAKPPSFQVRAIAEYEPCKGVIIDYDTAFSFVLDSMHIPMLRSLDPTNIAYVVVDDAGVQSLIEQKLTGAGISLGNIEFISHRTEEYCVWPRDWGPFFIYGLLPKLSVIDAIYHDFAPGCDSFPIHFCDSYGLHRSILPLMQEGGNYMTDGEGLIVCTDYFHECNPAYSPREADSLMKRYFEAERLVVLEVFDSCPGFGHIDIFAKLLNDSTIMISRHVDTTTVEYRILERCTAIFDTLPTSDGGSFHVMRIPLLLEPGRVGYNTYANSLILDNQVFIPKYFSSLDDSAIAIYSAAMPGYEIIPINNHDMVWFAGAGPHCLTKQVPEDSAAGIEEGWDNAQNPKLPACRQGRKAEITRIYPNPFTHNTVVEFGVRPPALPTGRERAGSSEFVDVETRHVMSLQIHDLSGRVVRTFHLTNHQLPFNQVTWDGRDNSGKRVPAGIYLCRLDVNGFRNTRKLILMK